MDTKEHEMDLSLPEVVIVGVIQYARDVSVIGGAVELLGIQLTFIGFVPVTDVLL